MEYNVCSFSGFCPRRLFMAFQTHHARVPPQSALPEQHMLKQSIGSNENSILRENDSAVGNACARVEISISHLRGSFMGHLHHIIHGDGSCNYRFLVCNKQATAMLGYRSCDKGDSVDVEPDSMQLEPDSIEVESDSIELKPGSMELKVRIYKAQASLRRGQIRFYGAQTGLCNCQTGLH